MRVVPALNAQRLPGQTHSSVARSTAKLSSGSRTTRAADEPAGLAIASEFGADIRGLEVARRSVTEAPSLVQIAEGAANTVHDVVARLKESSIPKASENSVSQRVAIGAEYVPLLAEIDRVAAGARDQGAAVIDGGSAGLTPTPEGPER